MKFKTIYIILLFVCAMLIGSGLGFVEVYQQKQRRNTITITPLTAFSPINQEYLKSMGNRGEDTFVLTGAIDIDSSILRNCYDKKWDQFYTSDMLSTVRNYLDSSQIIAPVNGLFAGESATGENENEFPFAGGKRRNAPDNFPKMLREEGFSCLAFAGLHANDGGLYGIEQTKKIVLKNGMEPVGICDNRESKTEYEELDIGSMRMAVLSYSQNVSSKFDEDCEFSVNIAESQEEMDAMCNQVRTCKSMGYDVVLVYYYFSNHVDGTISNQQRMVAGALLDAGADVIVGSNPDVIEPMEIRKSKTDSGRKKLQLVYYSLGDFMTGNRGMAAGIMKNAGMISKITMAKDTEASYITSVKVTPTYCVSYPTTLEELPAGENVRVVSMMDVKEYIDNDGNTKSYVTSTKPAIKNSIALPEEQESKNEKKEKVKKKKKEDRSDVQEDERNDVIPTETEITTEAALDVTTEDPLDSTTEAGMESDTISLKDSILRWLSVQKVYAVNEESEDEEVSDYQKTLTKSDFSYISSHANSLASRLFGSYEYELDESGKWFTLK